MTHATQHDGAERARPDVQRGIPRNASRSPTPDLECTSQQAPQQFMHPSSAWCRLVVLILICNITFGSYYCYDIPGALKGAIFDDIPEMTQLKYNLLYSLYSWPNTVQVFFGGYVIDRYLGVRKGCAICCTILVAGQALVCFGVQIKRVEMVLAGRFLFGIGGETLAVAQSAYAAQWFKGAELATAFGIVLSFSRIGSAVNFDISPAVLEEAERHRPGHGLLWAMYVGNMFCVFSLCCCLLLNWLDYRAERMRLETDSVVSIVSEDDEEEPVRLSDCLSFPLTVWLIMLITITFYAAVFVFLQNGVQFIHQRYDIPEKQSSFMMSLPYTVSALACPIFGFLVDKAGRAILWILLSTSALWVIQTSFALWDDFDPTIGVVGMGMCYSVCASALWPCISIIVEDKRLGTAYGLMTAFQNLGMAVFPIIISPLLPDADRTSADTTQQEFIDMYRDVLILFSYLACGASVSTLLLLLADWREGGWLNASAAALQERDILRARRSHAFSTVPALYTHHVHSRNKYLSRLGIRPLGGPRLFSETLAPAHAGCLGQSHPRGFETDYEVGSVQSYLTTQSVRSFDSSYHGSSLRGTSFHQHNYRVSDNGCSLENEDGDEGTPLMINGHSDDARGQEMNSSSSLLEARGIGDECLSASLKSRGLDGIANRGESLLDWALKETSAAAAAQQAVTSSSAATEHASQRREEPPLEGAGIPPVLGRVRGDSLLSAGSASSISRRLSDGSTGREEREETAGDWRGADR